MSDLKHQSVDQLIISRQECLSYIRSLQARLSGQESRLKWIDKYIFEKTPQEMTIEQIENKLGHRVIIK